MLDADYVPQHLLILACVLRYIMAASQGTILQKQELDAFIVQAFAMDMTNPNYLQDLQVEISFTRTRYWRKLFLFWFRFEILEILFKLNLFLLFPRSICLHSIIKTCFGKFSICTVVVKVDFFLFEVFVIDRTKN